MPAAWPVEEQTAFSPHSERTFWTFQPARLSLHLNRSNLIGLSRQISRRGTWGAHSWATESITPELQSSNTSWAHGSSRNLSLPNWRREGHLPSDPSPFRAPAPMPQTSISSQQKGNPFPNPMENIQSTAKSKWKLRLQHPTSSFANRIPSHRSWSAFTRLKMSPTN